MRKAILTMLALVAVSLAGCSDSGSGTDDADQQTVVITTDPSVLKEGRGAIAGLLIDDAFRPIPDTEVLLQELGEKQTTTEAGEFAFLDLKPGTYTLRPITKDHEAIPQKVKVVEGEFAEARIEARRKANEDGRIITTEYSVFVPCAASVPAASLNFDCTGDQSGDTQRSGFSSDLTEVSNITTMITEMRANKEASPESGAYKVVVRAEDDEPYYASAFTVDGDYLRIVNPYNGTSPQDTEDRNANWTNDEVIETLLFPQGSFKSETQSGLDASCSTLQPAPVVGGSTLTGCFESRGLGPQAGVRAQFVQSVFIGEPPENVDLETYCTLCRS